MDTPALGQGPHIHSGAQRQGQGQHPPEARQKVSGPQSASAVSGGEKGAGSPGSHLTWDEDGCFGSCEGMLGLGQPEGHAALSPGGPRPPLLVQAESVGVGQELAPLRGALHGVRKRGHRPYPEKRSGQHWPRAQRHARLKL